VRFLVDITDMLLPFNTERIRVLRALLAEIESGPGISVAVSKYGDITSAMIPKERAGFPWSSAILPSRKLRLNHVLCSLKVLIYFFGEGLTTKSLTRERKDDLAWNLAKSFEFFSEKWRERLVRFLDVDSDYDRRANFHHWLEERGLNINTVALASVKPSESPISIDSDDVLVLAGTSWRLDFSALEGAKNKFGFRLVCFVYDLIPVDYPSVVTVAQRKKYQKFLCDVGRVAELIVTPTAFVASRLNTFLAENEVRHAAVSTISLWTESFSNIPAQISPRLISSGLPGRKFLLCVSSLRERHHLLWLYALCSKLHHDQPEFPLLVLAGRVVDSKILKILSKDPAWSKAAIFIEEPLDTELSWLYQNAQFCLDPSFEGGLGIAVMDAAKSGRHCIAADTPSLVDASRGAAEHLPRDEALWDAAIRRALQRERNSGAAECAHSAIACSPNILSQIAALIEDGGKLNKET
jgi:hypothetical protein